MVIKIIKRILRILAKKKPLVFFIADAVLIAFSIYLAFFVRFEGNVPNHYWGLILRLILINLAIFLPIFYINKLYAFTWAYVSTRELISLAKATIGSFFLVVSALFFLRDLPMFSGFPRSILFISFFFVFIFCGGIRFAKRLYCQIFPESLANGGKKTLIIGAGDAGEQIARSILDSSKSDFAIVGYLDDNRHKLGNLIHGAKVLGDIKSMPKIVQDYSVEEIIIALPSAGSEAIKRAVAFGRETGLKKIKIVPSIFEVIQGAVTVNNIRDVDVADLLDRAPVTLNTQSIREFIQDKSILVTGAAGSIGSELCRQIAKFNPKTLLVLDQDETGIFNIEKELARRPSGVELVPFVADICDEGKIKNIFEKFRPDVVFHAAAYKHVPLMEKMPDEAVRNNILGTRIVASAALEFGAEKFVMISTDKAVNPTSVMGATKRVCEMVCQSFNAEKATKFVSVRFGNVLNSRGSVIPTFREQIKRGGPVEVTDPEMSRFFMLIDEACLLVMEAGAMGNGGEVFVLDMGKPVKIIDLAREMIKLSGFEPDKDIPIVFIGKRPGEKTYEEMLTVAEGGTVSTKNKKIFIAKLSQTDKNILNSKLNNLGIAARNHNIESTIAGLKETVSSYNPNNIK